MSSKNLVDTRQELADLVKRKTEIAVRLRTLSNSLFKIVFADLKKYPCVKFSQITNLSNLFFT